MVKHLRRFLRFVFFFIIVLLGLAYASLFVSNNLARQYTELFRQIYVFPETNKKDFDDWVTRVHSAIKSASANHGYREWALAASYPCMRPEFHAVEAELTEVNKTYLELLESPGGFARKHIWLDVEHNGDDALLPAPEPMADDAGELNLDAEAKLFETHLQWKGRRDDLRVRIDDLGERVHADRKALNHSVAGIWQGIVGLLSAAVDLVVDLWSWAQEQLGGA